MKEKLLNILSQASRKLVYLEEYNDKIQAQKREWQIKQLTRKEKLGLISQYTIV